MTFGVTLIAAFIALGACICWGWLGARPPNLRLGPRLVPYRLLMLLAAAALLLLVTHLVNLAGLQTGSNRFP